MTIAYLGEMTIESIELADSLRVDDEHSVWFFKTAYQIQDWAEDDEILVLFESAFAKEAEELKSRFITIEVNPEMSNTEILKAVEDAEKKLSTRIPRR